MTKLLTVDETAEQLGLSRYAVLDRIAAANAGDPAGLPAINIGSTGRGTRWRIEQAALDAWLESRRAVA